MLRDYTLALVTGFLLDCLLGDPEGLYHPVRVIGKYISWLEKRLMARGGNLRISALWLTASTVLFTMAALIAARICRNAVSAILPGHVSKEPADQKIMEELGMEPIIHARMALGEGTGGVLLLPLLDMALRVYHGPHTFAGLGMEAYTPQGSAQ